MKLFDFEVTLNKSNQFEFSHTAYDHNVLSMSGEYQLTLRDDIFFRFWLQYCAKLLFNFGYPNTEDGSVFYALLLKLSQDLSTNLLSPYSDGLLSPPKRKLDSILSEYAQKRLFNNQDDVPRMPSDLKPMLFGYSDDWISKMDISNSFSYGESFPPEDVKKNSWGKYSMERNLVNTLEEFYSISTKLPLLADKHQIMLTALAIMQGSFNMYDHFGDKIDRIAGLYSLGLGLFTRYCALLSDNNLFNIQSIVYIPDLVTTDLFDQFQEL